MSSSIAGIGYIKILTVVSKYGEVSDAFRSPAGSTFSKDEGTGFKGPGIDIEST